MGAKNELLKESEITTSVNLCDERGQLLEEAIGWSRQPVFNCNLSKHFLRKKKWNYWCVTNSDCLFSITISNLDYAAMVFAYFLDFKTLKFIEKSVITPFGKGCSISENVHSPVCFDHAEMKVDFLEENNNTHILVKCKNFNGIPMSADFTVIYPEGHETLNVVIPWNKTTFQFTSKQECLPADGSLTVGEEQYKFDASNTFACLDFGRGVWPRQISWNWANASGVNNDKIVGFNLGAKWTDNTGMTENCLIVDGRITKLSEDIIFEYDKSNLMNPWTLKTSITNRVNLVFTPVYERVANSNLLVIKSDMHQMIGGFSGTIITDSGETIEVENILGCSEEHFTKW